jgi:hypothetical protein
MRAEPCWLWYSLWSANPIPQRIRCPQRYEAPRRPMREKNRRLVPTDASVGRSGVVSDGFLCLTWGGYPDTLAPCRAPCEWNILARSIILLRRSYGGTGVMDRGDRRELSGQLRRSDMFIVPAPKQNRLKPHRGGMVRFGEVHAAPTELERIIGGTVTIGMSLLRSWAWAGLR